MVTGKNIVWAIAFSTFFIGTDKLHSQKGTFPLAGTIIAAEIPSNTDVYLVPAKKNEVVIFGIDLDGLDIRIIDKVLLIKTEEKVYKGHILIYYESNSFFDDRKELKLRVLKS